MKKSLLPVIMLFIAWAVSAAATSTPLSAIVRLEDAGSPNSRVHRSYAQVCPVGIQPEMCPTGHGFQPDGIGVLPHATRLVTLPGHTSAKLRCTRLLNESVSCGHVGDSLEYSAFPGGYFTPEGVFYYITDWQGNNIAVFSDKGALVQQTTYYPYGEPTIEPTGQRYLFGGKEREHAGGRNSYDYGPRNLGPSANWDSPDKLATETTQISPFSYCGGDPINRVDPTGMIGYVINEYGELQELILNDELDYIDIDTSDGQYIPGDRFPKGTIESYKQFSGGIDVFTIRGDENGKKIFEWLADNTTRPDPSNPKETTGIEFSFFQTGIEGDKGLNFISTSHEMYSDTSLNYLINNQLRFNYTIRTYIHNHPSGRCYPSAKDLITINKLDTYSAYLNFRNAQYFIYASKKYVKYDKNYIREK